MQFRPQASISQAPTMKMPVPNLNISALVSKNKENNEPSSKIEMFKNANFSFIELMNKNRLNLSL